MILVLYIVWLVLNIAIAWLHNQLRINAIAAGRKAISHGWWALVYAAICLVPMHWLLDWKYYLALILLHLSVFPAALNSFFGVDLFHLSVTSTALTDRFMVKVGLTDTAAVNTIALFASILLMVLTIILK